MIVKKTAIVLLTLLICAHSFGQKSVGIVLSGGGALGMAHIGILQALEEEGFNPKYVAGASMGAIIASFYCNGMSAVEIRDMVRTEKFYKTTKILTFSVGKDKLGLSSHKHVNELLDKYIGHNSFDSLSRHLYVSTVNLNTQKCEIIGSGDKLKEYVIASSSIPGVFEAVNIDGCIYVDGGTLNNFPAQAIRNKCDVLIGVDVQPYTPNMLINNTTDVAIRALYTVIHANSVSGRKKCDYIIDCFALEKYSIFDFNKFEELYQYGYNIGKEYLAAHPDLKRLLNKTKK